MTAAWVSGVFLWFVRRSRLQLTGMLRRALRVRRPANDLIFLGEMLPCLLIVRHDLRRAFEGAYRFPVADLFDVGEPEMFPDRSVIRVELGRGPEVIHRGIGLAHRVEAKPELGVDQEIVR